MSSPPSPHVKHSFSCTIGRRVCLLWFPCQLGGQNLFGAHSQKSVPWHIYHIKSRCTGRFKIVCLGRTPSPTPIPSSPPPPPNSPPTSLPPPLPPLLSTTSSLAASIGTNARQVRQIEFGQVSLIYKIKVSALAYSLCGKALYICMYVYLYIYFDF